MTTAMHGMSTPQPYVVVVVVVVLTLTHGYNAVRGHRTEAPITLELKITSGGKQIKNRR